jgi:selenocysteine lyase/cysteine desulfurase
MASTVRDIEELQALTANNYFGELVNVSWVQQMELVRARAAAYLGCTVNETVLFPSTTVALNTVVEGLVSSGFLQLGDAVVTSNQEHPGGLAAWQPLAAKGFITLDVVPLPIPDDRTIQAIVDQFASVISARTKVLAFSHVLTTTGMTLPVMEIAAMARARGVRVIIDGAQALGTTVDATALGVDVYVTSAHKWLLAPTGNGVCCIRQPFQPSVQASALDGGLGIYTRTVGTRAAFPTLGLGHALEYLEDFGPSNIAKYNVALAAEAWAQLSALQLRMLAPAPRVGDAPIVSFALPAALTAEAVGAALLSQYGVVVKMTGRAMYPEEWPDGAPAQALRLTFHLFNSRDGLARLIAAIRAVCIGI